MQEGADGRRLLWHYGWEPGAYPGLYLKLPDDGLTLVLLANGDRLTAPFAEEGLRTDVTASAFAKTAATQPINGRHFMSGRRGLAGAANQNIAARRTVEPNLSAPGPPRVSEVCHLLARLGR